MFDKDDYRNMRFTNSTRQVNPNWGIKLVNEIPPKECTERVTYCDGGDGPLGHPKVYINLVKTSLFRHYKNEILKYIFRINLVPMLAAIVG